MSACFRPFTSGGGNFERGGGAPERGAHPSKIAKKIRYFGSEILNFTNITR
jgi:hypothetical protein